MEESKPIEEGNDAVDSVVEEGIVRLSHGRALSFEDSYPITAASRARLILLAGLPKSGKTTLIASLFHGFQKGPFAGYAFSGSETLLGFDERCHDARISSRRSIATTERTKTGTTDLLLHLKVTGVSDGQTTDILFVDMSGEHHDAIRDSVEECRNLAGLRRADHFVLLLDGEKLADTSQRQKAKTDAFVLLRSCLDSDELRSSSLVDIVITKWDLALGSGGTDEVETFAKEIEAEGSTRFSNRCARLRFMRIAARPTSEALPFGWGLVDLFAGWVRDIPEAFHSPAAVTVGLTSTEFDRFRIAIST
ncbi:MAG TPA: hypothetical protein VFE46_02130 [Pirellulales bacterium]|jgi:hypothetical protein|nr:hypothetical protein [Pirellulales bacterium]